MSNAAGGSYIAARMVIGFALGIVAVVFGVGILVGAIVG